VVAVSLKKDLLLHDAQYTAEEYPEHVGWGHSSIPHTLAFATVTGVMMLVPVHHDPAHSDEMLDQLFEEARHPGDLPFELVPGTEGSTFHLGE
jgi:ribonuclease BN (tRNA processing enzyme)